MGAAGGASERLDLVGVLHEVGLPEAFPMAILSVFLGVAGLRTAMGAYILLFVDVETLVTTAILAADY